MRSICPKCHSHSMTVTSTEVICNCCDTTVDFKINGTWAYDAQPVNLLREAKMYNRMYHKPQAISNMRRSTR